MKKASLVVLLLIWTSFTAISILPERASANTLCVGGGGPGNYTTIQAAVDNASSGDTVYVYSGTYYENVLIGENISLVGEDRDTTIIDGGDNESVIRAYYDVDFVNVSGFTVINGIGTFSGHEAGIEIRVAKACRIYDNNAWYNDFYGIAAHCEDAYIADNNVSYNGVHGMDLGNNCLVVNNTLEGNGDAGIGMDLSENNIISNNRISSNRAGILMTVTENITLRDNVMFGNGIVVRGYRPKDWNTHDIDISNTVNGKPVYYWKFVDGGTVPFDAGQVILANSTNVLVKDQDMSNASVGVSAAFSSNLTIVNNTVNSNPWKGMYLRYTFDSVLASNTALFDRWGIVVWDSRNLTIIGNNVSFSDFGGLSVSYTSGGNVSFNSLWENRDGTDINAYYSENIEIYGNQVSMNDGWYTIRLDRCKNSSIAANTISRNGIIDDGIGLRLDSSENVTAYHNNFIENKMQAYDTDGHGWDNGYPSGGNYWSDYNGTDNCTGPNQDICPSPDGLGDTPYSIPGNASVDSYPLMSPVSPPQPPQRPSAPQNLSATGGDRQVMLNWDPPVSDGGSSIVEYMLYRGTSPGSEVFLTRAGIGTSYVDQNLLNGQIYYYEVTAMNIMGEGPRSEEASATPATFPGPPLNLSASAEEGQVTLTWSAPLDNGGLPITNYSIFRGMSPGLETFIEELGNVYTYADAGLVNGQTYYYKVSAKNSLGEGPQSVGVNATPTGRPGPPRNLMAATLDFMIYLTWNVPSYDGGNPIQSYLICRGLAPGGETYYDTTVGTTFYDSGVTESVAYYYVVSAVNMRGEGPFSNEVSVVAGGRPSSPQDLQVSAWNRTVTLTWSAPIEDGGFAVFGYRVYRGTTSNEETHLDDIGVVLTYKDAGVLNGVTYYYVVSAVNSIGEGPKSSEVSITPENERPVCNVTRPQSNGTIVKGVYMVEVSAFDPEEMPLTIQFKIDEGDWINAPYDRDLKFWWNTMEYSEGDHVIYARAYDGEDYSEVVSVTAVVNNSEDIVIQIWPSVAVAVIATVAAVTLILYRRRKREETEE